MKGSAGRRARMAPGRWQGGGRRCCRGIAGGRTAAEGLRRMREASRRARNEGSGACPLWLATTARQRGSGTASAVTRVCGRAGGLEALLSAGQSTPGLGGSAARAGATDPSNRTGTAAAALHPDAPVLWIFTDCRPPLPTGPHHPSGFPFSSPPKKATIPLDLFFFLSPPDPPSRLSPTHTRVFQTRLPQGTFPAPQLGVAAHAGEWEADTRTPSGHPHPPATPGGRRAGGCGAEGDAEWREMQSGVGCGVEGDAEWRGMLGGGGCGVEGMRSGGDAEWGGCGVRGMREAPAALPAPLSAPGACAEAARMGPAAEQRLRAAPRPPGSPPAPSQSRRGSLGYPGSPFLPALRLA